MIVANPFDNSNLVLPDNTRVITMKPSTSLEAVDEKIEQALDNPICSKSLFDIAKGKSGDTSKAVIVVSDNTRPVPYKGDSNILVPIIKTILKAGFKKENITILIATGMHKPMSLAEQRAMLDPYVFEEGIKVVNHDPQQRLQRLGYTKRGTAVDIDQIYMDGDLKVVTGLIESHFMAGTSGGRKAICPGLIGKQSTCVFHGPLLMADENSTNLNLENNPVSSESLEIAGMATIDFLVNVTLDHDFRITGIFAGDYIQAHKRGSEFISQMVSVEAGVSDVVITHGGFVGINHYQCAKAAVACIPILNSTSNLILLSDTKDEKDNIGSQNYRKCLKMLTLQGPKAFYDTITDENWTFLVDQWQVQQWGKVFERIPMEDFYFYSPSLDNKDFDFLPGNVLNKKLGYNKALDEALQSICKKKNRSLEDLVITYISDGPYVVVQS